MGFGGYDTGARSTRAATMGYATKSVADTFTQSRVGKAHDLMNPKGVRLRECRDSQDHPDTVPIVLGLDVTGSMGHIPHQLIKEGLPTLMGNLIQKGVPDASLLFIAVGDHECDRFPLQVGQFESADEPLDLWLTRTYLEGGGGGNAGESYQLAWDFASRFVETDAFSNRGKKGFLITVGDEPVLKNTPVRVLKEIYGEGFAEQANNLTTEEILARALEKFEVFHIHLSHRGRGKAHSFWNDLLGQRVIEISDYTKVPETIVKIVLDNLDNSATVSSSVEETGFRPVSPTKTRPDEEYL